MANFDDFKLAIEALSGGKNTVLFDDMGMPSVMVPFAKMKASDVITGGSQNILPCFSVNGVEKSVVYMSKFANITMKDRAYSLPMRDPRVYVNFDQAVDCCRNKGAGWSLAPLSLWSAIALWSRKNGTMPRGNNNYGCDVSYPHEKGVPANYGSDGKVNRTLTGSGPATWNHNWLPDGVADMTGNINGWLAGARIVNGEIQIIPYGNVFDPEVSLSSSSTAWKAIAADGSLVEPGTAGTLKYDWVSGKITLTSGAVTSKEDASRYTEYKALGLASGLVVPEIAKLLLFYPDEPNGDYGGDGHWANMTGERLPVAGGGWSSAANAGVFRVNLSDARSTSAVGLGFWSAYVDLNSAN